jgi:uncharacterized repeat protein (TIGR02543 family)
VKRKWLFGDVKRASKLLPISLLAIFLILVISVTHTPPSFAADVNITFDFSGISSDASGTIITINTVDYAYTDLPLSPFVWATGSTHTVDVPVVSAGTGKQYVWSSWTNGDGLSGSSGTYTTPGSDASVTVNYVTQWEQTFEASANVVDATGTLVSLTPSGGTCTASSIDTPGGSVYCDEGTSLEFSFQDPVSSSVSGKQYGFVSADETSPISVTAAETVTGTYETQYMLTMATNFGTTDPSPGDHWYDEGTILTITATAPTPGAGEQYVWNGWTGSGTGKYTGPDNPAIDEVTMSGPITETASWTDQYYLTVNSDRDTPGGEGWYDSGDAAYATLTDGTVPGATGVQYVFTGWSDDASGTGLTSDPITMDGPKTATANWMTQYQVTFTSSGIGSDTGTTTVVTINTVEYQQGTPLQQAWFDSGSTIDYAYSDPVTATTGKRYAWISTSGLAQSGKSGTFTVTGTGTVTGTYKTQYYFTVTSTYDTPSGQGWYDSGSFVSSTVVSPVSGGTGTRYVCTGWTGTGSAPASGTGINTDLFIITEPSSVTWNWKTQYSISFDSSGIGTDTGYATIVRVNGVNFRRSQLPYTAWYDDGSTITYAFSSPVSGSPGRQYMWTSTSGLGQSLQTGSFSASAGGTVTGNYNSAYMAAIIGAVANPDPSVQGSSVTFTVTVENTGTNNMNAQVKVNVYRPNGVGGWVWAASPVVVITSFLVGSQRIVQVSYTTALTAPTDTWTYSVEVYYGTTLLDSLTGQTFKVDARLITGTIVSVTAPTSPVSRGTRATFTVTVKNTGNVAWASGTIKITIFKSGVGTATTLYATVTNVQPNDQPSKSLYWLVPLNQARGSYTYTVYLYYGTTQLDSNSGTITVN